MRGLIGRVANWLDPPKPARSTADDSGLPRLFVDLSIIARQDSRTGIQRVVRAVTQQLLERDGRDYHLITVAADSGRPYRPVSVLGSTVASEPIEPRAGDVFLGLDLAIREVVTWRRQLASWQERGVSLHFLVYDLLPLSNSSWFEAGLVRRFERWFAWITRNADGLLSISQTVADDVIATRPAREGARPRPPVTAVRLGADLGASLPSEGISAGFDQVLKRMKDSPAALMIGTVEPRKGYEAVLNAFDHLWARPDAPELLVIAGKPGWKVDHLCARLEYHRERWQRLFWLPAVSDEELELLYGSARGVIMASRGEGLGLPLLEALMHRRPVLARDIPVFREQERAGVMYFESDEPSRLGSCIQQLINQDHVVNEPSSLPTWSDTVDEMLAVLFPSMRQGQLSSHPVKPDRLAGILVS